MKKKFAYLIIAIALIQGSSVHAGKFGKFLKKALPSKKEKTPLCIEQIEQAKSEKNHAKQQKKTKRAELSALHLEALGFGDYSFSDNSSNHCPRN